MSGLTETFHTFAGGLAGASDLHYAREVADWARTQHHEIVLTLADTASRIRISNVSGTSRTDDAWVPRKNACTTACSGSGSAN